MVNFPPRRQKLRLHFINKVRPPHFDKIANFIPFHHFLYHFLSVWIQFFLVTYLEFGDVFAELQHFSFNLTSITQGPDFLG